MAVQTESEAAFETRMRDVVVAGHTLIGLSVGVSLGLFEAMCTLDQPFTSNRLAQTAKCKERYVREWLHHMVVVDIVDVDETGSKYMFPEHRRNALASYDQLVPGTASSFPYMILPHREVLECFRLEGPNGLEFSKVAEFAHQCKKLPSEQADLQSCAQFVTENIQGLKNSLNEGATMCDLGSGEGGLSILLASRFPRSTFLGVEVDEGQFHLSQDALRQIACTNLTFHLQDACALPSTWTAAFDYVIMRKVFHDVPLASKCAAEMWRCLKPGGKAALIEYDISSNIHTTAQTPNMKVVGQLLYPSSYYHCLITAMLPDYSEGLGSCPGKEVITGILSDVGFVVETVKPVGDQFMCLIVCCKP